MKRKANSQEPKNPRRKQPGTGTQGPLKKQTGSGTPEPVERKRLLEWELWRSRSRRRSPSFLRQRRVCWQTKSWLPNRVAFEPPRRPSGTSVRSTEQRVVVPTRSTTGHEELSIEDMEISQLKVIRESSGMRRERRSLRRIREHGLARCCGAAAGTEVKSESSSTRMMQNKR